MNPSSSAVVVREVGLRDGLQSIASVLPTARKREWLRAAHAAGLREVEAGSFVPARRLPQLADTAEVLAFAKTLPGLSVSVLVPNLTGAQRALDAGADLMLVPLSASRAHSLANLRRTPDEAVAEVARMRALRDASGARTLIEGGVGTAFGCTLQGRVDPDEVLRLLQALLDAGADRVSLADTVGHADPAAVRRLFASAVRIAGDRLWCGHFHDTRGLALANVCAAMEVGVARFDASLAGLGGCPHAPGASGNVATEDLVFMLERMGRGTGIDVRGLLALRERLAGWLPGERLYGTLWRAGLPEDAVRVGRAVAAPAASAAAAAPAAAAASAAASSTGASDGIGSAASDAPRALPLAGVRVLEFTHMVMGPTCGMILADLGAEVIKVEPPGGDKTRRLPGLGVGFFRSFNRNKKSIELDINTEDGRATAAALAGACDVVIENFRPGLMASLGLDHATLSRQYPRLIYVSHKGFLPGPYEHRTALDEVVQMMGGLSYMTGPEGRPLRAGASVNDIMGGMFGAIGVLAALHERARTGRGQEVQSALFENCVFLVSQHMQQYLMTGEAPPPMPARVSAWSVYDVFTLAGGRQLFVGAVSDRQFQALCRVLGRDDLATDPALATNAQRVALRATLIPRLAGSLKTRQVDELCGALEAAGLPYAPIVRPEQLVDDPHLAASGGIVPMTADDGTETRTVLLPMMLGGRRPPVRMPLPRVGEHTEAVLAELLGRPTPSMEDER